MSKKCDKTKSKCIAAVSTSSTTSTKTSTATATTKTSTATATTKTSTAAATTTYPVVTFPNVNVASPPAPTAALAKNGDFSDGKLAPFTASTSGSGSSASVKKIDGNYVADLVIAKGGSVSLTQSLGSSSLSKRRKVQSQSTQSWPQQPEGRKAQGWFGSLYSEGSEDEPYADRVLRCLVLEPYGRPLVDFRDPLKPTCPEEAQEITLPTGSVIETIVLLKVLLI